MFDLETNRVIKEIENLNKDRPKIVFQAPEGLKLAVEKEIEIIRNKLKLKNIDAEIYLWGNSCFGACDLIDHHVRHLDIDLIVHYGHERLKYADPEIKTIFVPGYHIFTKEEENAIKKDIKKFVEKHKIEGKDVTIATTLQYKKLLKSFDPDVILGCRGEIKNKDVILFVGTGRFHPLMIAYKYQKEVYIYNPISKSFGKIDESEINKLIKRRIAAVSKLILKKPKKVGIILSTKKGQCRKKLFKDIVKLLEKNDMDYLPILVDNLSPDVLYYNVDCYIVVACPRIVLDDYIRYEKPIYTPEEFKLFIDNRLEYKFDEIRNSDF